jgi:hypothetical protein
MIACAYLTLPGFDSNSLNQGEGEIYPWKGNDVKRVWSLLLFFFAAVPCVLAQQAQPAAADDTGNLVKQTQNPVASLISVPFQNNLNFPVGPFARYQDVLNFQPVIPIGISSEWNLITRAILPVINRQDPLRETGSRAGLGDLSVTFFLSPKKPGKIIWGVGPVLLTPTATASVLGADKWGAGPSVVALVQPKGWTIGALANNVWSFAGGNDTPVSPAAEPQRFVNGFDEFIDRGTKVNSFMIQYFVNRNYEQGWYLTSSPILTANWELPSDERWIVPFGGGVGRVFKIGHQPVNLQVQNFYNVIHPKTLPHPQWQFRVDFILLFPKK